MPCLLKDPWMFIFQFAYSRVESAILLTAGILMSSVWGNLSPVLNPALLPYSFVSYCSWGDQHFVLEVSSPLEYAPLVPHAGTWPAAWLHNGEGPKCLATLWRDLRAISHVSPTIKLHLPHSLYHLEPSLEEVLGWISHHLLISLSINIWIII